MTAHFSLEWLSGYLDGQVTPEERRQVEAHLDACPACRTTLADLQRTVALVAELGPVGAPVDLRAAIRERLRAERSRGERWRRLWPLGGSSSGRPTWRAALATAAVVLVGLFAINLWREVSLRRETEELMGRGAPAPRVGLGKTDERQSGQVQPGDVPAAAVPLPQTPGSGLSRPPFERQVIRTADLQVEVSELEDASRALVRIAESSGGFVAESTTSLEEGRFGTFVLRVPAPRFSQVLDRIEALGKVTGRRVSGQDVTEEFVDLQSRIRNLEAHERRLLALMERASRVADLLAIERELSRVRNEIETLTGRLRFLENRVELATIQVALREKAGQGGPAFWDFRASVLRVRDAFLRTVRQLLAASEWVAVTLSALTPVILLGLAGWGIFRRVVRRGSGAV